MKQSAALCFHGAAFYIYLQENGMENMQEIEEIKARIEEAVKDIKSSATMREIKMKFLGKAGEISSLMKKLRDLPPEMRPEMGKIINALREWAENRFDEFEKAVKTKELGARYEREKIDVTLPGKTRKKGAFHPDTMIVDELVSVFAGMGFEIYEGREIETDYYNFTALNTPKDHPARDMQDTFYLGADYLLRTQTSAGQVHVMENKKPPIKILSPGKVYRPDDDATHSPMFSQMEGLVVDKGITLCDLKGMLDEFAARIFGSGVKTRLRPSYFRRSRRELFCLRRQGLQALQGHGLDRSARRGHGKQGRTRKLRHRSRRIYRLRVRHGHRTHSHAQIRHKQHETAL